MYDSYLAKSYSGKKDAVRDARSIIDDWGHVTETHKYSIQIGSDFIQLLAIIHGFDGCDEIKSMMEETKKERKMYFFSHLSFFYKNNCEGR